MFKVCVLRQIYSSFYQEVDFTEVIKLMIAPEEVSRSSEYITE